MIDQPKDFKVRNDEGEYLGFNFNASEGKMEPLWGPVSMSYPFVLEEARRLANVFAEVGGVVVTRSEWEAESKKRNDEMFGTHTYYGNGRRR